MSEHCVWWLVAASSAIIKGISYRIIIIIYHISHRIIPPSHLKGLFEHSACIDPRSQPGGRCEFLQRRAHRSHPAAGRLVAAVSGGGALQAEGRWKAAGGQPRRLGHGMPWPWIVLVDPFDGLNFILNF